MEKPAILLKSVESVETLSKELHARLGVDESKARCWITRHGAYYRVTVQRLADGVTSTGRVGM